MKVMTRLSFLLVVLCTSWTLSLAQEAEPLTAEYKAEAIQTLSQLMNDFYVFPEVAKQTEEHLLAQLEAGHFDQFDNDDDFAAALTESVQSINHDKHMRIRAARPYVAPPNSPERMIEERLDRMDRSRQANGGFNTVKILEGNVGYLDLRGFAGMGLGKPLADAYMGLMSRTDAIIVDLSKNGGGSPRMVQYLCSFFFDEHVHLNSLYWREGDVTEEFWTLDEVGGEKMPDVPLFVITSDRTFSGAEEFSYNMQTQERATLVGQTSGGGANPGGTRRINENLMVFIPTGKAINPITNTNWEGVGVVPHVETTPEEAFDKAHELAIDAAENYRASRNENYTLMLTDLNSRLEGYTAGESEEEIHQSLMNCLDAGVLREDDINSLGYEYLMRHEQPKVAQVIFKSNTILHPNSANVFDSYGESLMMTGDLTASLENYQRAVEIAAANEDPDLELFERNLQVIKDKISTSERP